MFQRIGSLNCACLWTCCCIDRSACSYRVLSEILYTPSLCSHNIRCLHQRDFINFCLHFDIPGLCETLQLATDNWSSFLTNYVSFECVRHSYYGRGSGGIFVADKETFVQTMMVKRIFPEFPECVILLIESQFTGYNKTLF